MMRGGIGTVANAARKTKGGFVLVLLVVALLAARAWPQPTQSLDVIWTIPGDTSLYAFGASLASGDVNGDGIPDILVACDTYDGNHGTTPLRGRVNIYYGNHIGETKPDIVLRSPVWVGSNTPRLAYADLNGDGYADIVMGEDMADTGIGIVTIWMGGNPMDTTPAFIIRGRNIWWLNNAFGWAVSVGDVNGDGHADLAVSAYFTQEQPGRQYTGRVYVFFGGSSFDSIPDVVLRGGHGDPAEEFGTAVSAEGDFDHDGFHDFYIGASNFGYDMRGRMYAYYGGNPLDTSADMAWTGEGPAQFLGDVKPGFLKTMGDFDYGVEGSPSWPHGFFSPNNCGKVYIHKGGRPMDSIPYICLLGRKDSANLGMAAQSAGDATGDRDDDLVAGAPLLPHYFTGATYLWQTGNHFDTVPDAWIQGSAEEQSIGYAVSTAGDLDGDGRAEFMVSNYPSRLAKYVWVCKYVSSGIEEEKPRPLSLWRLDVVPNPARGAFSVNYDVPNLSRVSVSLYDIGGRLVRSLSGGYVAPGRHEVKLPSGVLPAGVYFCTLDNGTQRISRKVVLTE
ncbi:MAG TPA: FG-GAP-like repeat-containing protein [bacterium]|nr:FG-GAP-like repeat-containing protein [bacterium]